MKKIVSATLFVVASASIAAAGGFEVKDKGTNAKGSTVGVASSAATGNGHVIGQGEGAPDQTTGPGTRAAGVQALHAADGRGRDK
jgi:hypothetical protein